MNILRILVLAGALMPLSAAASAIQVCRNADGSRLYTDTGCPAGTAALPERHVQTPPQVRFPELSDDEHRRLRELAQRSRKAARRQQQHSREQRQAWARTSAARQARCEQARQALRDLRHTRRQGYSLAEAQRLDASEEKLRGEIRAACG